MHPEARQGLVEHQDRADAVAQGAHAGQIARRRRTGARRQDQGRRIVPMQLHQPLEGHQVVEGEARAGDTPRAGRIHRPAADEHLFAPGMQPRGDQGRAQGLADLAAEQAGFRAGRHGQDHLREVRLVSRQAAALIGAAGHAHGGDHMGVAVAQQHGARGVVEIDVFGAVGAPHPRADGLHQLRRAMLHRIHPEGRGGGRVSTGAAGRRDRHQAVL